MQRPSNVRDNWLRVAMVSRRYATRICFYPFRGLRLRVYRNTGTSFVPETHGYIQTIATR